MSDIDLAQQRSMWNEWNRIREEGQDEVPLRQARMVVGWLDGLQRSGLDILDVGCGAGWLEPWLTSYGRVTAIDLADEVLARARARHPGVTFIAGNFMDLELAEGSFDVVVSLEVLSHVADQAAFIERCAALLRPGGLLMLATQNRPVLERLNHIPPPRPGQLRRWVDAQELRDLLERYFVVDELFSCTPKCNKRHPLRLLTSSRIQRVLRPYLGAALDAARSRLEQRGYGWTLMVKAQRRPEPLPH
jgi:SAM-dependent methyltransferase